ncbi:MAG: helix-turn-helix domain-containing protein [Candidatus Promineifilaceae bacterium]|nr:helix-turn-helix domain-containing protein [Candidatus Promineifilaceae bacterium]
MDLVNIIFGMKVRQARTQTGMTLTEFAERCDLSPSYMTEIEKGRKYPKTDKIIRMAEALDKSYDELVSIKLDRSLNYLETALTSPLLKEFPFEAFGLELGDVVNLLTRAPAKASALLHTMLEIGRQYNLKDEHFLRAALRSYQELHENYFQELEDAAAAFTEEYDLGGALPVTLESLERIIRESFGYELDWERLAADERLATYRSVLVEGSSRCLLLNSRLYDNQIKFLLAREMGYQYLDLKDRAYTSAPDAVDSFQQVFNDFKASYFAGAVLMPRSLMIDDIQSLFRLRTWQPDYLPGMLEKYDVTPEMLLYRFSELIPQFFGIRLHFLRFHSSGRRYRLVKQLNMNRLLLPSGIALHEHFCRRWLTVRLLRELQATDNREQFKERPHVGAQISEFHETRDRFLCLGFARPLVLSPEVDSSVIVGFRVDGDLRRDVRFVEDPALPSVIINETCERCPLTAEQCTVRAVPPTVLEAEAKREERREALNLLMAELRE